MRFSCAWILKQYVAVVKIGIDGLKVAKFVVIVYLHNFLICDLDKSKQQLQFVQICKHGKLKCSNSLMAVWLCFVTR